MPISCWAYTQTVNAGQTVSNETVNTGRQTVNGTTNGVNITGSGSQQVNGGGVVNHTTINGNGSFILLQNGQANNITMNSGGANVYGEVNNLTMSGGHFQVNGTLNGATATGGSITINVGENGTVDPYTGGRTNNVSLTNATLGNRFGVDTNTVVNQGGLLQTGYNTDYGWNDTAISNNATVNQGGVQSVDNGGTSNGSIINVGGTLKLLHTMHNEYSWDKASPARGTANNSIIYGSMNSNGGVDNHTIVKSGGIFNLSGNASKGFKGESNDAIIEMGGVAGLSMDAHAKNWAIQGTTYLIDSSAIIESSHVDNGGQLQVKSGKSSDITVNEGGVLSLTGVNSSLTDANIHGHLVADEQALLSGNINITSSGLAEIDTTAQTSNADITLGGNLKINNSNNNNLLSFNSLNMDSGTATFEGAYTRLTTEQLSGNGLFNMRADLIGQQGDLINVTGSAAGHHVLSIQNQGSNTTNGTETLTVVQTNDGGGNFSLSHKVEAGGYLYDLRKAGNDKDWELYHAPSSHGGTEQTSSASAGASFLNTSYLLNYIDNQTLLQRLGDLRLNTTDNIKDGFWVRSFGGKLSSFAGSTLSGFDMPYSGTQLGIDKGINLSSGTLLVGSMVGITQGNSNYQTGNGTSKNYSVGLYTTYYDETGFYLDALVKYNNIHNQFNVKDSAGNGIKGKGRTSGVSSSVEIGQRVWMTDLSSGFYIEPQAQLSIGTQGGDTVHADNGLRIKLDSYNTALGRMGTTVGYHTKGSTPFNIYIKSNYVRELSGNASYRLNGNKEKYSFRGEWWDNGIGVSTELNKTHQVYLDANYAKGNKFNQKQLNLGYRYSF